MHAYKFTALSEVRHPDGHYRGNETGALPFTNVIASSLNTWCAEISSRSVLSSNALQWHERDEKVPK